MNSNVYVITVIIIIVLISLITVFNNTYIFKRDILNVINDVNSFNLTKYLFSTIESFENNDDTTDENSCSFSKDIKNIHLPKYNSVNNPMPIAYKDDIEGPLTHYKNISRKDIETVIEDISEFCYVSHYQQNISHMNEIYQKVVDDIDKSCIKLNTSVIQGPIYIIIVKEDNKEIFGEINIDVGANTYRTELYIIYSLYKFDNDNDYKIISQKNQESYQKFNEYIKNLDSDGKCDMYIINSKNKMFYNLV